MTETIAGRGAAGSGRSHRHGNEVDVFAQIQARSGLPDEEMQWMRANVSRRRLARNELLYGVGQNYHETAFVESGILQVSSVTYEGEEVVLDYVFPGEIVVALDSAIRNLPSKVDIRAIRPATLVTWPYDMLRVAYTRHPLWMMFEVRYLQYAFLSKNRRYTALRTQSARQRYLQLDSELPPDWRRIPLGSLASFLGISQQYLSKLRGQLE
jgi:CRP-like cAMP-binding protein